MWQFVSWHSAQSVTRCIQLSVVSQLLVKLEISLTLSGEIDNSNVKRVGEVSRYQVESGQPWWTVEQTVTSCGQIPVIPMDISITYRGADRWSAIQISMVYTSLSRIRVVP